MKITPAPRFKSCTITATSISDVCGAPAAIALTNRDGHVYYECAEHALPSDLAAIGEKSEAAPAAHPRTRSLSPWLILNGSGEIVGYAHSKQSAEHRAAARPGRCTAVRNSYAV